MDETTTATPEAEVFEFKHPKTHRTLTLPMKVGEVDMKSFLESIIEKSKVDAKNKVQAQLAELEAKVSDYDLVKSQLDELQTSGLTAAQKAQKENERILKQAENANTEAKRLRESLHAEKVNNAVFRELGNIKGIVDVNKAATLFNAECKPKLVERNGEFFAVAEFDGVEVEISEAKAKWIARDDNKFLLQNTLSAGAGSTGGSSSIATKQMKRTDFFAQPPAAQAAFIKDGGKVVE
jgi:hypothetical protein